jgi:hypothetical protein
VQTPDDALIPFRRLPKSGDQETFWSSEQIRDTTHLGYQYEGKYIKKGESGNEIATFPIQLRGTKLEDLNSFVNQFYSWTDFPMAGYPSILSPYFPIDISQVEALTGKEGPDRPTGLPSNNDRIPENLQLDPNQIDYGDISEELIENGDIKQWSLRILAEK